MINLDKTYNSHEIEEKVVKFWEKGDFAKSQPNLKNKKNYSIVIPPPNVTGSLHLGHGFQYTLMDLLIRYHRMKGFNTLWQVGTDHAGIAMQMIVTQKLRAENIDYRTLSREEFLKKLWEWKDFSRNTIVSQMKKFGISVDWHRERFTLDDHLSEVVRKVFVKLYDEGLIYRGKKLVNFDPVMRTAVSDLEVINKDQDGFLWHIRYPIVGSDDYLVVATTRPETLFGDAAVAVNPKDERYQHLIGKTLKLPLTNKTIPVISDSYVEKEFGTGCVKITPAHDFNDYEVGKRHNLPILNILNEDASLNSNVPSEYQGLDRFVARKKVIEDLERQNLLEKIEPYKMTVPVAERTGAIVEPFLTDQWFLKSEVLAKDAVLALQKGELNFVPKNWENTYLMWLNNIQDWCISRQLVWGHRIPAFYDEQNNIYVGMDEADVRQKYNLAANCQLRQDPDVLDTWFSSSLWPFATLDFGKADDSYFQTFYPTNVLVTGFDIIFFWVARMVMMGLKFTKRVPFHDVYITGIIRDFEGAKMSKSKGNVLDPIDLIDGISLEELLRKRTSALMQSSLEKKIIEKTKKEFPNGIKAFGIDALRFTCLALASTSRDINFDIARLDGYKNFCNKIWNAARFIFMQEENENQAKNVADLWIISRLQKLLSVINEVIPTDGSRPEKLYRFDVLANAVYEFIWHEFCDWYLEFCKIYKSSKTVMLFILETILRVIHPMMPFISEEIWQKIKEILPQSTETIMLAKYPEFDAAQVNDELEKEINLVRELISTIRNLRNTMNVPPKEKLDLVYKEASFEEKNILQKYELLILKLAGLRAILQENVVPQHAVAFISNNGEFFLPLGDIIDLEAEKKRLQKEIEKLEKQIFTITKKLQNHDFIQKAPAEVVQKEQNLLKEYQETVTKLDHIKTNL